MKARLHLLLAAALAFTAHTAFAQEASQDGKPSRGARAEKAKAALEKRFAQADANHDGKLSRDEAKAGMPKVYQHFDEIDADKAGFVTLDQVKTEAAKLAAEKRKSKG